MKCQDRLAGCLTVQPCELLALGVEGGEQGRVYHVVHARHVHVAPCGQADELRLRYAEVQLARVRRIVPATALQLVGVHFPRLDARQLALQRSDAAAAARRCLPLALQLPLHGVTSGLRGARLVLRAQRFKLELRQLLLQRAQLPGERARSLARRTGPRRIRVEEAAPGAQPAAARAPSPVPISSGHCTPSRCGCLGYCRRWRWRSNSCCCCCYYWLRGGGGAWRDPRTLTGDRVVPIGALVLRGPMLGPLLVRFRRGRRRSSCNRRRCRTAREHFKASLRAQPANGLLGIAVASVRSKRTDRLLPRARQGAHADHLLSLCHARRLAHHQEFMPF